MNKAELIEALAQRSGLQKQKAKKLLEISQVQAYLPTGRHPIP